MIHRNQGATRHPRRYNGTNGNGKEEEEVWFLLQTAVISLNSINQLSSVMVKCGVFFDVWTEFLI
jgi:hypothetical protein